MRVCARVCVRVCVRVRPAGGVAAAAAVQADAATLGCSQLLAQLPPTEASTRGNRCALHTVEKCVHARVAGRSTPAVWAKEAGWPCRARTRAQATLACPRCPHSTQRDTLPAHCARRGEGRSPVLKQCCSVVRSRQLTSCYLVCVCLRCAFHSPCLCHVCVRPPLSLLRLVTLRCSIRRCSSRCPRKHHTTRCTEWSRGRSHLHPALRQPWSSAAAVSMKAKDRPHAPAKAEK